MTELTREELEWVKKHAKLPTTLIRSDALIEVINRLITAEGKLEKLPADWSEDSSLETWFPLTASLVTTLKNRLVSVNEDYSKFVMRSIQDRYIKDISYSALANRCSELESKLASHSPPDQADDKRRMDWLVSHYVEVRTPLLYGSHELFVAQCDSDDDEEHHTTLREQIDAEMEKESQLKGSGA